nr:MAG TPA: prohead serine protease [Herelleviridae sp.]
MFTGDNFSFWFPIEPITKAVDPETGEEVMRVGGIASTIDSDADGESLDPSGFDVEPLKRSGMVNWHHQAKNMPAAIIGEPSKVELRPEGLWIESDLYPSSQMAQEVYALANTLEQDSKTRRLGYSVEGKVIKRGSKDKKSPLYNKILKAVITGVAITHMPKNPNTFVNIIKGHLDADGIDVDIDEEDDNADEKGGDVEKKALTTESGAALKKESVDPKMKNQTFAKSEVMERLFSDIPNITIEKAEKVYTLIKHISDMNKKKTITNEDIEKAFDALGIGAPDTTDEVKKSDDDEHGQLGAKEETHDDEPRHNAANAKRADEGKKDESEEETEEDDEGFEECDKNGAKMKKGEDNDILKAIQAVGSDFKTYIRATAVLVNDLRQKRAEDAKRIAGLEEMVKGYEDQLGSISERLEKYGSAAPRPKSLRAARVVERHFAKGDTEDDIQKGGNGKVLSMKRDASAILDMLDAATLEKGYDVEYGNAVLAFEASHVLPRQIIDRVRAEKGITITE